MIASDDQLKAIISQISTDTQSVCDYIGPDDPEKYANKEFLIEFPRGYIFKVSDHKRGLDFINNKVLIKNMSYLLLLSDLCAWTLNRTDVGLTVREMVIKSGIMLYAAIMESLLRVESFESRKPTKSFNKRINEFVSKDHIDSDTSNYLLWLWKTRDGIHLYTLNQEEYNNYSDDDYNKATIIVMNLLEHIKDFKAKSKQP